MKVHGLSRFGLKASYSDEWYTPQEIVSPLGHFDLDPCSPEKPHFKVADQFFTSADNGLLRPWHGRVWLNPPYSDKESWVEKLVKHGNGIALLPVAPETRLWINCVWGVAHGVIFLSPRVIFLRPSIHGGLEESGAGGTGSALIAYGQENADLLRRLSKLGSGCGMGKYRGHFVQNDNSPLWDDSLDKAA